MMIFLDTDKSNLISDTKLISAKVSPDYYYTHELPIEDEVSILFW